MPTHIEWVRNPDGSKGKTWPVVTGCSHAGSPGCDMCYAARMAATRLRDHPRYKGLAVIHDGKPRWTGKVNLNYNVLEQPLHWRKPRMVFVASMGDLFHEDIPDEFILEVFITMYRSPQHMFQLLTKRPHRMMEFLRTRIDVYAEDWYRLRYGHVWLGVSVENQAAADERIPLLLQTPAAVRFVSVEPMLGAVEFPVDFNVNWLGEERIQYCNGGCLSSPVNGLPYCPGHEVGGIDWVICGGESGPGARPMHPDWARSLRDQCQAAGTPYFFKQWGKHLGIDYTGRKVGDLLLWTRADGLSEQIDKKPGTNFGDGHGAVCVGKKRAGRLLDGRTWQEFPVSAPGQS